jgi:prophage regulatory protein
MNDCTKEPFRERILRQPEVEAVTSLKRTSIWRLERAGDFPKRRKIAPGINGWLASEIDEWMRSRPLADEGADI